MRFISRSVPFLLLVFVSFTCSAQYFQLSIGYGVMAFKGFALQDYERSQDQLFMYQRKSYGQGLNTELITNYLISDKVGVEAGFLLINSTFSDVQRYNSSSGVRQYGGLSLDAVIGGRFAIESEKASYYASLGGIIGLKNSIDLISESYSSDNTLTFRSRTLFSKGFATGFYSKVGYIYSFGSVMKLCTEVKFMSLSYAPGRSDITEFGTDDFDQLPTLSTNQKSTVYQRHYNNIDINNPTMPKKAARIYFPYSAAIISVGVQFGIGL